MELSPADQAFIALGKLAAGLDALDRSDNDILIISRSRPEVLDAREALADMTRGRREVVVETSHSRLTYYWDAEKSKLMVADKSDLQYGFESQHNPQTIRDAADYIRAWGVENILAVDDLMKPRPEDG